MRIAEASQKITKRVTHTKAAKDSPYAEQRTCIFVFPTDDAQRAKDVCHEFTIQACDVAWLDSDCEQHDTKKTRCCQRRHTTLKTRVIQFDYHLYGWTMSTCDTMVSHSGAYKYDRRYLPTNIYKLVQPGGIRSDRLDKLLM